MRQLSLSLRLLILCRRLCLNNPLLHSKHIRRRCSPAPAAPRLAVVYCLAHLFVVVPVPFLFSFALPFEVFVFFALVVRIVFDGFNSICFNIFL